MTMRLARLTLAAFGTIALIVSLAATATAVQTPYYWYGDGTNLGGSGTWDTTLLDWSASNGATISGAVAWPGTTTYDAYFQGTGGTVTTGTITAGNLIFSTAGYSLTGTEVILANNGTVAADTGTTTIGAKLTTTGAFYKYGAGTLYLGAGGKINATTKAVHIYNGTIKMGNGGLGIYSGVAATMYDGGTLDLNGQSFANNIFNYYLSGGTLTSTGTGIVSSTAGAITANAGYSSTVSVPSARYLSLFNVKGDGALTTIGNGYAAGLTSGRISFTTSTQTGALTIQDGVTTFNTALSGSDQVISLTTGNLKLKNGVFGTVVAGGYTTPSFTRGLGTGAGQVQWDGDGGFGALSTNAPTLTVNIGGAGAGLAWGQQYFVQDGSKLVFGGADLNNSTAVSTVVWVNPIDLGNAARTIDVESYKTDAYAAVARMDGILSGSGGGLTKTGAGVLKLTADNTYTGDTSVEAGKLQIDYAYLSNTGDVLIADNASLVLNYFGDNPIGGLSLGGVLQTQNGTYGSTASGANFQNDTYFSGTGTVSLVPEPGMLSLLGCGLLGLLAYAWRKRK